MADSPNRRSALDEVLSAGVYGATFSGDAPVTLCERTDLAIVQIACWEVPSLAFTTALSDFCGFSIIGKPQEAGGDDALRLAWISEHRWLLIAEGRENLADELTSLIEGFPSAVTDLSHARTVIRLTGPAARDLLAKGSSVDMHQTAFPAGETRATSLAHFNCLIDCNSPDRFDIHFMRSFAHSGWEWLTHAAETDGYAVTA